MVSACSLVAISVDRYLAIIYPLRPRITRPKAKVVILSIWLVASVTAAPLLVFSSLIEPPINWYMVQGLKVCVESWGPGFEQAQVLYSAVLMILQYFLPVAMLIFTYARIGFVVWGKKFLGETPVALSRTERTKKRVSEFLSFLISSLLH